MNDEQRRLATTAPFIVHPGIYYSPACWCSACVAASQWHRFVLPPESPSGE